MDLQLAFNGNYFDLRRAGAGLATDEGLRTAVIVSLFSDRRAEAADAIPDGSDDHRGWWGDAYAAAAGDRIGSRLWLLGREKDLAAVARRAEEYAREALVWLTEDGAARAVAVEAEPASGLLGLAVRITRPDGSLYEFAVAIAAGGPQIIAYPAIPEGALILDGDGNWLMDGDGNFPVGG